MKNIGCSQSLNTKLINLLFEAAESYSMCLTLVSFPIKVLGSNVSVTHPGFMQVK